MHMISSHVKSAQPGGPIGELAKTFTTHRSRSGSILAAMWNDTDIPLGYLITFRCYGTWLHGDDRGSTDRYHNIYNSPHIPASQIRRQHNTRRLKSGALILDANQRQSVEIAIRDTPLPQVLLTCIAASSCVICGFGLPCFLCYTPPARLG